MIISEGTWHTHTHTHTQSYEYISHHNIKNKLLQLRRLHVWRLPAHVQIMMERAGKQGKRERESEREREREREGGDEGERERFFHSLRPWWFKEFRNAELTCDEWQHWFCEMRCHGDGLRELLGAYGGLSAERVGGLWRWPRRSTSTQMQHQLRQKDRNIPCCHMSLSGFAQLDMRKVRFHITYNYFGNIRFDLLKIFLNILYIFGVSVPQLWWGLLQLCIYWIVETFMKWMGELTPPVITGPYTGLWAWYPFLNI